MPGRSSSPRSAPRRRRGPRWSTPTSSRSTRTANRKAFRTSSRKLGGGPPFRGGRPWEPVKVGLGREPVPPSRLRPRIARDLEAVCRKALAREPDRRYSSALALAQDLERFQAGESILARREGVVRKAW